MVTTDYEVHPAAMAFPMMQETEYRELVKDIQANGQRQPCAIYLGLLLDGRNRLRACQELGIEPLVHEVSGDTDPVDYVVSMNIMRRQLTKSQRSMVAATLATLKRGGDRKSDAIKGQNCLLIPTIEGAAGMLNVSPTLVKHAKKVIEHGAEELADAVRRDAVTVSLAAKLVDSEPDADTQATLALQGSVAIRAHLGIEKDQCELIEEKLRERPHTAEELLEVAKNPRARISHMRQQYGYNILQNSEGQYYISDDPIEGGTAKRKRQVPQYEAVADEFAKLTPSQKQAAMRRMNADPAMVSHRERQLQRGNRKGDGTATDDMTNRLEDVMHEMQALWNRCNGRRKSWLAQVGVEVIAGWVSNAKDIQRNATQIINELSKKEGGDVY